MINLMYVVLMALLALNVPSDVLNGFSLINDSLLHSTANSTGENNDVYKDFAEYMKQNPEKVKAWYTKAMEGGSVPACYRLGVIYQEGRAGQKDPALAETYYKRCSEVRYTKAMVRLADMYLKGEGVPVRTKAAVKLFSDAANEGNTDAMFRLGELSLTGEGMAKSTANAKKWFQKASYRGHEGAKEALSKPPFA